MSIRDDLLEYLAGKIAALDAQSIVAIDGADGSGKTMFAGELSAVVEQHGRPVIRASIDGFHNPRSVRYRRGKGDPQGFFLESYNYDSLKRYLIDPFRAGATTVETARFDHRIDQEVTSARYDVLTGSVLLLDGIFLHRDELQVLWDQSIFLDVPFAVTFARMAIRDGANPNPRAEGNRRYVEGQRLYFRTCKPQERATFVIDNSLIDAPKMLKDRS